VTLQEERFPSSRAPGLLELEPIIFGAPFIGEEEIAEVVDTLRSGWLGTGPKTKLFESLFARYVGQEQAVATNSCTAALHLSLDALDVGPGDEVITTPLTFVATANAIEHCGATPVFVDVRPHDGNLDPEQVAAAVTPRTKAILAVHYCGAPADVHALQRAHPHIPIVVDAAHAIEARYEDGSASGTAGTLVAYSFYVTKNLVTGEGGMVVSADPDLLQKIRIRSLHGLDNDAWKRYSSGVYAEYEVDYPGFKYNMTDLQASLGLHQLKRIEESWLARCRLWNQYTHAFEAMPSVSLLPLSPVQGKQRHALHLFTLLIDWKEAGLDRSELVTDLHRLGIGTGWHFRAVHLHRYYSKKYGLARGMLPVAEGISERSISIPLSAALTESDAERIIMAVAETVNYG